jgi:hypothetical protein
MTPGVDLHTVIEDMLLEDVVQLVERQNVKRFARCARRIACRQL